MGIRAIKLDLAALKYESFEERDIRQKLLYPLQHGEVIVIDPQSDDAKGDLVMKKVSTFRDDQHKPVWPLRDHYIVLMLGRKSRSPKPYVPRSKTRKRRSD